MAKGPLEKALEKHQKEIERQVKKQIEADKKLLISKDVIQRDKQGLMREENVLHPLL